MQEAGSDVYSVQASAQGHSLMFPGPGWPATLCFLLYLGPVLPAQLTYPDEPGGQERGQYLKYVLHLTKAVYTHLRKRFTRKNPGQAAG